MIRLTPFKKIKEYKKMLKIPNLTIKSSTGQGLLEKFLRRWLGAFGKKFRPVKFSVGGRKELNGQ